MSYEKIQSIVFIRLKQLDPFFSLTHTKTLMTYEFQKGDKVRILSKSLGGPLEQSSVYKQGKGIGYISRVCHQYLVVHWLKCMTIGDYFQPGDLEHVQLPDELFIL